MLLEEQALLSTATAGHLKQEGSSRKHARLGGGWLGVMKWGRERTDKDFTGPKCLEKTLDRVLWSTVT